MIIITLDNMLKLRNMTQRQLAAAIPLTEANLSNLKSGKIKGIRLDTLDRICEILQCQPGDILRYVPDEYV